MKKNSIVSKKNINEKRKIYKLHHYTENQFILKFIKQKAYDTFTFRNFTGAIIDIKLRSKYDIELLNSLKPAVFDMYLFFAEMDIWARFDEEEERFFDQIFVADKLTHALTPTKKLDIAFLEQFTKEKNNMVYVEY